MGVYINGQFHPKTGSFKANGPARIPAKVLDLIGNFTAETVLAYQFTNPADSVSTEYSVDGGPWLPVTTQSLSGITVGTHSLKVRGVNKHSVAGPESDPVSYTVLARPNQITNLTGAVAGVDGISFAYTIPALTDHVEYSLNGGAWTLAPTTKLITGLSQGNYALKVRAVNANGYAGPESAIANVALFTLPSKPTNVVLAVTSPTSLTLTATAGTSTASLEYTLDGSTYQTFTSGQVISGLTTGSYTVKVRGVTAGGLRGPDSDPFTQTLYPLPGAPTVSLTRINSTSFQVVFSETANSVRAEYSLDGAAYTLLPQSPFGFNNYTTAVHTFAVRSVNANGFPGPVTTQSISLYDIPATATAPTLTALSPTSFQMNYANVANAVTYQYSIDSLPFSNAASSPMTFTSVTTGVHTAAIRGVNAGGVAGPSSTTTTLQLYPLPGTPATPTATAVKSTSFTLNYTLPTNATAIQYSVDGGAFVQTANTSSVTVTGLSTASHNIVIRGVNANGFTGPSSGTLSVTLIATYSFASPAMLRTYNGSNSASNNRFGREVSVNSNGSVMLITDGTGVLNYRRSNNNVALTSLIPVVNGTTNFGTNTAVSDDGMVMVIGSTGKIHIYQASSTAGNFPTVPTQTITNADPGYGTTGLSVCANGSRIAVRSNNYINVVFKNGSLWQNEQSIDFAVSAINPFNGRMIDQTGYTVAMAASNIFQTYYRPTGISQAYNSSGFFYSNFAIYSAALSSDGLNAVIATQKGDRFAVYNRSGGSWTQLYDSGFFRSAGSTGTGSSVSMSYNGSTVVLSSDYGNYSEVFTLGAGNSYNSVKSYSGIGEGYGASSMLSNDASLYMVGAPAANVNATSDGATYVYYSGLV